MIQRYSTPEMAKIWSDKNHFLLAARLELIYMCVKNGLEWSDTVPILSLIEPMIDVEKIREYEVVTKHETVAFIKHLSDVLNCFNVDASKLHYGLTSSDILDSVMSAKIMQSIYLIKTELANLKQVLSVKAALCGSQTCVGRTHGIFAEDIPISKIFNLFKQEIEYFEENILHSAAPMKLRGPVGEYKDITEREESITLTYFKTWSGCFNVTTGILSPKLVTQVVGREYYANIISKFAIFAASFERFVTNIRLYSRTEVNEITEAFADGQFGSSAMPHKKNPIKCENLTGISRLIRSYVPIALENIVLWHERDMSHSSVEREIFPSCMILTHYAIKNLTTLVQDLSINFDRIEKNKSLIDYKSQDKMNDLINKGVDRFSAYAAAKTIWCQLRS